MSVVCLGVFRLRELVFQERSRKWASRPTTNNVLSGDASMWPVCRQALHVEGNATDFKSVLRSMEDQGGHGRL
jgi:hypothetical protein